jgi:hypothetical protein
MYLKRTECPRVVRLSDGTPLSKSDLPSPNETHWTAARKSTVVQAVDVGLLVLDDALALYDLSAEEFDDWRQALRRHGKNGLKATVACRMSSNGSRAAADLQE